MKQAMLAAAERIAAAVGYDKTHITRTVAYREVDAFLDGLGCEGLDALEVAAGWKWRQRTWRSFTEIPYELITFPEFAGNVIPIFMSCNFSTNPSMLVSRRCRGSVQSRRRGPGLAACLCFASFNRTRSTFDFRHFTNLVHHLLLHVFSVFLKRNA